jgi:ribosomal-protein-alanine N-acetyltransferase
MSVGDLPAVLDLEQALFPEDAWTRQMFAEELAQCSPRGTQSGPGAPRTPMAGDPPQSPDARYYLVAENVDSSGGALSAQVNTVGYAGLMFPGGPEADVLTLAVATGHWGMGIGSALLTALLTEAARRDCTEVFLEVRTDNVRAQRLYRRYDFTDVGLRRGYYQPSGADALVMRRILRPGEFQQAAVPRHAQG